MKEIKNGWKLQGAVSGICCDVSWDNGINKFSDIRIMKNGEWFNVGGNHKKRPPAYVIEAAAKVIGE